MMSQGGAGTEVQLNALHPCIGFTSALSLAREGVGTSIYLIWQSINIRWWLPRHQTCR